jgi:hypothetical protein
MKLLHQGFACIKGGVLSDCEDVSIILSLKYGLPGAFERLCKSEQGGVELGVSCRRTRVRMQYGLVLI